MPFHSAESAERARTPNRARVLLRFDKVERVAHWANASLFLLLIATALPLYFVQVERLIGRRHLLVEIHVWTGIALPIPLLISLAGPWGSRLRADLRRCNLWTNEELLWLRSLGRHQLRRAEKFNPGQKLNLIFIGVSIVLMLGTGSIMYWVQYFPLQWRGGATFVHDVFAAAIVAVITGHVVFALTHFDALKSMFTGYIDKRWAERHAPRWLEELDTLEIERLATSPTQGEPDATTSADEHGELRLRT